MKDADILAKIRIGDESALEYLYQKYYRMMIKLVTSNSGTEYEAKDIYQEALIVLWQKAVSDKLVLTSKLSTYLYSICQNLWRKELDRKSRLSNESHDGTQYMEHDRDERGRIIRECIEQLGETCQKVLTYYYFDGMSMSDIADKLNFSSTNTAKTKKYKCKKRLDQLVKSLYKASDFLD
jgi:RNA polymerase sigma factor (sigma-70 family)